MEKEPMGTERPTNPNEAAIEERQVWVRAVQVREHDDGTVGVRFESYGVVRLNKLLLSAPEDAVAAARTEGAAQALSDLLDRGLIAVDRDEYQAVMDERYELAKAVRAARTEGERQALRYFGKLYDRSIKASGKLVDAVLDSGRTAEVWAAATDADDALASLRVALTSAALRASSPTSDPEP